MQKTHILTMLETFLVRQWDKRKTVCCFAGRNESMSFTNAQVVFTEEDGEE
jgi:hypothetical protein